MFNPPIGQWRHSFLGVASRRALDALDRAPGFEDFPALVFGLVYLGASMAYMIRVLGYLESLGGS